MRVSEGTRCLAKDPWWSQWWEWNTEQDQTGERRFHLALLSLRCLFSSYFPLWVTVTPFKLTRVKRRCINSLHERGVTWSWALERCPLPTPWLVISLQLSKSSVTAWFIRDLSDSREPSEICGTVPTIALSWETHSATPARILFPPDWATPVGKPPAGLSAKPETCLCHRGLVKDLERLRLQSFSA